MPFGIGQALSPTMLELLARKQEQDRQSGFEAQRINLAARAQRAAEQSDAQQLDLSLARLRGEDADRALRGKLAERDAAMDTERLDLSRQELALKAQAEASDTSLARDRFGLEQEESLIGREFKERGLKLDEAAGERATQELGLSREKLEHDKTMAGREFGLKLRDADQQTKLNEARIRDLDTDNELKKTALADTASSRRRTAVASELRALGQLYSAARGDGMTQPDEATIKKVAERVRALLSQLEDDPELAKEVVSDLPPDVAARVSGSPFAAGSGLDVLKGVAAGLVR